MSFKKYLFAAILVFAFFVFPLYLRFTTAVDVENRTIWQDVRAAGLDAAILASIALVASIQGGRVLRWIVAPLVFIFGIILIANIEFISVFDRPVEFSQVGFLADPTFFWSSVVKLSHPIILFAYLLFALLLVWGAKGLSSRFCMLTALAITVMSVGVFFIPLDPKVMKWRQVAFVPETAKSVASAFGVFAAPKNIPAPSKEAFAYVLEQLKLDLSGSLVAQRDRETPNILIIVLESVSGAYLPSFAKHHGIESNVEMKSLDAFMQRGRRFSRFIAHQRQTSRGTYAMFCGDLPSFSTSMPKLERLPLSGKPKACLPESLRKKGYTTHYLQAAPLSFAQKDKSLPLIGFESLKGAEWFGKERVGTGWGAGDGVLFEAAISEIEKLDKQAKPWMMTLLNVGTHHPFDQVPDSFVGSRDDKTRSFEYLDHVLGRFFAKLDQLKILDDTIVLVTSDESGGVMGRGQPSLQQIGRNWSLLSIVYPTVPVAQVDEVAGQMDVFATFVDFLRLSAPEKIYGRSLLRDYQDERSVFAYHNHDDLLFRFDRNQVTICPRTQNRCQKYKAEEGRFGRLQLEAEVDPISDVIRAAEIAANSGIGEITYELLPRDAVAEPREDGYLFCCKYFKVGAGETLTIDLDLGLLGEEEVDVTLDVVSNEQGDFETHFSEDMTFHPANEVELQKSILFSQAADNVEVRMYVSFPAKFAVDNASVKISRP